MGLRPTRTEDIVPDGLLFVLIKAGDGVDEAEAYPASLIVAFQP